VNRKFAALTFEHRAYYMTRAELEIPLGSGAKELGLRPSIFVDAGAVFKVASPILVDTRSMSPSTDANGNPITSVPLFLTNNNGVAATTTVDTGIPAYDYRERFLGDSIKPRLSVGIGVNWRSPFGPFRIDVAKALLKEPGDDTKLITFNVGTQF
jgi:outer membrane protein insertion porin family